MLADLIAARSDATDSTSAMGDSQPRGEKTPRCNEIP
jgi:hypothetical protein